MTPAAADTLPLVRDGVKRVLTQSAAFRSLDPGSQRQLAHDMVKVARYIVDAGGQTAGTPMKAVVSTGLAGSPPPPDRVRDVKGIGSGRDAQQGFDPNAAKQGGKAYTDMVRDVDFPSFVAGLIDGVFNAIVTSSIKQMEAYSALVANIAKSVDEYMRDNVTPNQARDYLAGKYPEHLQVDTSSGQPTLKTRDKRRSGRGGRRGGRGTLSQGLAAGASELPDFMKDLGLPEPVTRLDNKTAEEQLVPAARRRMAMDRQELLATMVLMGINRLIVTDGKISASCLFELDTLDSVYQDSTSAADFDEHTVERQRSTNYAFWFIPSTVTRKRTSSNFKMSTTNDRSSESSVEMHAKLAGNVDINFRSETFPLEKMADILQIREIEQKAPAAAPAPPPAQPAFNLPPPPPLPSLPGAPGAPAPAAPAPGG